MHTHYCKKSLYTLYYILVTKNLITWTWLQLGCKGTIQHAHAKYIFYNKALCFYLHHHQKNAIITIQSSKETLTLYAAVTLKNDADDNMMAGTFAFHQHTLFITHIFCYSILYIQMALAHAQALQKELLFSISRQISKSQFFHFTPLLELNILRIEFVCSCNCCKIVKTCLSFKIFLLIYYACMPCI